MSQLIPEQRVAHDMLVNSTITSDSSGNPSIKRPHILFGGAGTIKNFLLQMLFCPDLRKEKEKAAAW